MIDTRLPIRTDHPGRRAYLAYWRVLAPLALPWEALSRQEQRAWQAAAQAVQRRTLRIVRARTKED